MTKENICKALEQIITQHGFTYTYTSSSWLPMVNQTNDDYAGITFREHYEFDQEHRSCTITITCQGRVCRMGGNDTFDDLMRAAEQIKNAACLAQLVNDKAMTYTETW